MQRLDRDQRRKAGQRLVGRRNQFNWAKVNDQIPSDEVDTIAYAVSFSEAAKRLADTKSTDNHPLVVPFYMLIGFAIENGLKAALEYRVVDKSLGWFHSHDLSRLRELAQEQGLNLGADADIFIDQLSPHHNEHHFRYPQKAKMAHLLNPRPAVGLTDAILVAVFSFIDGHARRGKD